MNPELNLGFWPTYSKRQNFNELTLNSLGLELSSSYPCHLDGLYAAFLFKGHRCDQF